MSRRKTITKAALVFSSVLIAIWVVLGANTSIAWFMDDDSIVNTLNFGDLKVGLYYKTDSGYEEVDLETEVFDDAALYEPGYTQVVCLRIDNESTMDFTYDMSVVPNLKSLVVGKNEKGGDIVITDYLMFGLVFDTTEDGLAEKIKDRDLARTYATNKLSDYSESGGTLTVGSSNYCALVLYMPEEVTNEANYRGKDIPRVEVGIGVLAKQIV